MNREATMTDNTAFDVVGPGYVAEHHIEDQYRHRLDAENASKTAGPAFAWLAFYATAIVVIVLGKAFSTAPAMVAASNQAILLATGGTLL
jgi:hypothetical protein